MTAKIYKELPYFNIKIAPIRYGLSKATYSPDKETHSIYKGLSSIKFVNSHVAEELFQLSQTNKYHTFIDLLFDIHNQSSANFKQIRILTTLNYFSDFGKNGKLLQLIDHFEKKLKNKGLKEETKQKRLIELRDIELRLDDESIGIKDQIKAEIEFYGYETTTIEKSPSSVYMVTVIDDKYTPKLRLYCLKAGEVMEVKCKKTDMKKNQFGEFTILQVKKLSERNKRKKVNDQWVETDDKELYLSEWVVLK
jgi:DNA polymerase III alpha subunit